MDVVHDFIDASSIAHGPEFHRELGSIQEFQIGAYWNPVQYYKKDDWGKFWNYECVFLGSFEPYLAKIYNAQRSSNDVDKSTSIRKLGFRVMLGRIEHSWCCNQTMGRSSVNFEDVQYFQRVATIGWRTHRIRVDKFPRIQRIAASPQFRKIWKETTSFQKISVIDSSSCPCSMTLNWKREEMKILALWLQEQSDMILQGSKVDIGHSWDLEKKTSTMIMQPLWRQMGSLCFKDGERFREFGTSSIQRNKSVGPWYLEEKERPGHHPF